MYYNVGETWKLWVKAVENKISYIVSFHSKNTHEKFTALGGRSVAAWHWGIEKALAKPKNRRIP